MSHGHHHHIHDVSAPLTQEPAFSLLRLPAGRRIFGAVLLLAGLWAAVFWALHP